MDKQDFLVNFRNLFEETDINEIKFTTQFRNLDEWSSLTGLMLIAMLESSYGKKINASELKACNNVDDIFNLIAN